MLDAFLNILPNLLVILSLSIASAYLTKWLWLLSLLYISILSFSQTTCKRLMFISLILFAIPFTLFLSGLSHITTLNIIGLALYGFTTEKITIKQLKKHPSK